LNDLFGDFAIEFSDVFCCLLADVDAVAHSTKRAKQVG
jgi:hypothetical protein